MTERETYISKLPAVTENPTPQTWVVDSYSLWRGWGLSDIDLDTASEQVHKLIAGYISMHFHEMLDKNPQTIRNQFLANKSVMIITLQKYGIEVIAHGTNYENFTEREAEFLGMQVVEVGSVIVAPPYQGQGYGTLGTMKLTEKTRNTIPPTLAVASIKQASTAHIFDKAKVRGINYWTHPYLTYLICTCEASSERAGYDACNNRRLNEQSNMEDFQILLDKSQIRGEIPCTALASDDTLVAQFEDRCRELHRGLGSDPVAPGEISIRSMQEIQQFFSKISAITQS